MEKQDFIDKALRKAQNQLEEEVSGLLGEEFLCQDFSGHFSSGTETLAQVSRNSVLVRLEVTGEREGDVFLIVGLTDAILLGGTLILLPDDEMNRRRKDQIFDEEIADAFGEIANIISGAYTNTFNSVFSNQFHFKKMEATVFPTEGWVPPSSFAEGAGYLSTGTMSLEGKSLGPLLVQFPLDLLGFAPLTEEKPAMPERKTTDESDSPAPAPQKPRQESGPSSPAHRQQQEEEEQLSPLLLIAAEDEKEGQTLSTALNDHGCRTLVLSLQDNIRGSVGKHQIQGVFLILKEVGDRGMAAAIKLRSALSQTAPMVMGAPRWTRKDVLKAVKYGACDILVTPAADEDVLQKMRQHMSPTTS